MTDVPEKFDIREWIPLHVLAAELVNYLDAPPPSLDALTSLSESGFIPAKTLGGGLVVKRRNVQAIANTIADLRRGIRP